MKTINTYAYIQKTNTTYKNSYKNEIYIINPKYNNINFIYRKNRILIEYGRHNDIVTSEEYTLRKGELYSELVIKDIFFKDYEKEIIKFIDNLYKPTSDNFFRSLIKIKFINMNMFDVQKYVLSSLKFEITKKTINKLYIDVDEICNTYKQNLIKLSNNEIFDNMNRSKFYFNNEVNSYSIERNILHIDIKIPLLEQHKADMQFENTCNKYLTQKNEKIIVKNIKQQILR